MPNESAKHPLRTAASGEPPAGYIAPMVFQTADQEQLNQIQSLPDKILKNPLLLRRLADHVYELMKDDLHQERERFRHYGGLF